MKTVIVFLADGFEEIETITVIDYLRRAGVEVIITAVGKDNLIAIGSHKISVKADTTLSLYLDADRRELPDAVYSPGGMLGAKNIAGCKEAIEFVMRMNQENRLVTAICASPAFVLSKANVLKNKRWTCYPGLEDNAGSYVSSYEEESPFVTDGNLVTGKGAGTAEQFAMELVRILCGENTAENIRTDTCQR